LQEEKEKKDASETNKRNEQLREEEFFEPDSRELSGIREQNQLHG
jgi:hypothetical protein